MIIGENITVKFSMLFGGARPNEENVSSIIIRKKLLIIYSTIIIRKKIGQNIPIEI